jgi:hypothetical protein
MQDADLIIWIILHDHAVAARCREGTATHVLSKIPTRSPGLAGYYPCGHIIAEATRIEETAPGWTSRYSPDDTDV